MNALSVERLTYLAFSVKIREKEKHLHDVYSSS